MSVAADEDAGLRVSEQLKDEAKELPPLQSWQLVAALFLFVSFVEAFVVSHMVSSFLPLYLEQLGVARADVPRYTGFVTPLVFIVGLPLIPFWSVWADRFSRKLVIARSAYVEALVFLCIASSQNVWQLAISISLSGLQLGNSGVMLAALRSVTPKARVGFALSVLGLAGPLGFAVGPALGGLLLSTKLLDYRGLYLLDAALSLLAGVVVSLGFRERRRLVKAEGRILGEAWAALKSIVTLRFTLIIFAIFSLLNFAQITARAYLPLLVQRANPDPANEASAIGFVVGTAALVGVLFTPLTGWLGDRLGYRPVLGASLALVTLSIALLPFAPTLWLLAGCSVLFGAAGSTAASMVYALLATETPEERRSSTLNLVYVPVYIGGIVGPILAATMVGFGLTAVLLLCAAGAAATLLLWARIRQKLAA